MTLKVKPFLYDTWDAALQKNVGKGYDLLGTPVRKPELRLLRSSPHHALI